MPQIIIRETDYTSAATGEYENFAVVVPGFYNSDNEATAAAVLDENGVYEVSSASDFVNNIGKVAPTSYTYRPDAVAPTVTIAPRKLTASEIKEYSGQIYTATERGDTEVGKLTDFEYTYTLVSDPTVAEGEAVTAEAYAVIEKGNEGTNGSETAIEFESYGNQIAYELLRLGYTVLFKSLGANTAANITTAYSKLAGDILDTEEQTTFWTALTDKASYDFRFIVNGLIQNNAEANKAIIDLAAYEADSNISRRGDCVALCDIDESVYTGLSSQYKIITKVKAEVNEQYASLTEDGKYGAFFMPTVYYTDHYSADDSVYDNSKFPAAFHYLACFAHSHDADYAEWYAIAGYTRGVCDFNLSGTSVKLGEIAINGLEPRYKTATTTTGSDGSTTTTYDLLRPVNVIACVRNSYLLWGNRTAYTLGTKDTDEGDLVASSFLNIRQLCTTLKKQIYIACRNLNFDPNSDVLWINFCNAIRPTLEAMKADQGIEDYKIVRVATSQKAKMAARVRIIPIEAVEDFDIEITLEDDFGDVTTTVTE